MDATWLSGFENSGLRMPYGICSFAPAARLQTQDYLSESQRFFERLGAFHVRDLDCDREIQLGPPEDPYPVAIPSMGLVAKKMVLCQGVAANENRLFSDLPLHPARGDILVVESRQVHLQQVVHHQAWAVPIGQHRFLVGATYDRAPFLKSNPDNAYASSDSQNASKAIGFRRELETRWESIVKGTFAEGSHTVLEQRWGVRPASYDRHPLIGAHDVYSSVYCMNGLGSKGTLMAPRLAELLLDAMQGATIEPSLLRSRRS